MGFLLVLKAEMTRNMIIMRRYWFATLIGMFIGYSMLVSLAYAFVANRASVQEGLGHQFGSATAVNATLGLLIGMLASIIVGLFSNGLQAMARSGELEQLCMSPHGLMTNFVARSFVSALSTILSLAVMFAAVDYTLGGTMHLDRTDILLLIVFLGLTYVNLIGFGFLVGGLVLVFKQTGPAASVVRMILLGIALAAQHKSLAFGVESAANVPVWLKTVSHIPPVTDAAICLKLIITGNVGLDIFTPPYVQHVVLLFANCAVWTVFGLILFKIMERYSRSKGTLGAY